MSLETDHLTHSITKFSKFISPSGFPTVTIDWQQPRRDTMVPKDEARLWEQTSDGYTFAGVSFAASPHTNATLKVVDLENYSKNVLTELPPDSKVVPAHCVVWWGKEQPEGSIPMNRIAHLPPTERRNLVNAIADQTAETVYMFETLASWGVHDANPSKHIRIYGLWGHADKEQRTRLGLSRGSQSHPEGHLHVVHFSRPEAVLKPLTNEELLKQLGSWDTVIHEKFESEIVTWLQTLIARYDPRLAVSVYAKQEHGKRSDNSRIVFFEGYQVQFLREQVSLATTLDIISFLSSEYDVFYEHARNFYDAHHLQQTRQEQVDTVETFRTYLTENFGKYSAKKMENFILQIPPTHGQYQRWNSILAEKLAVEESEQKRNLLQRQIDRNTFRMQKMTQRLSAIQQNRDTYVQHLQALHGVTDQEASLLLSLAEDRLKPATDNNQFTFPVHSSGSFLISNYTTTNTGIEVRSFSLSSRLATNKGVVEDLSGVALRRPEAK